MSDDEVTLAMSVPLDSDGFVRRECPTCEREFKWLHTSGEEGTEPVADGGYFCPYCGVQAPTNGWLTQAQAGLAQNIVEIEVIGPMLRKFTNDVRRIGRGTGGRMSFDVHHNEPARLGPLTEVDDMTRVDFACHPSEPVKILDDWRKTVHCLICGQANS